MMDHALLSCCVRQVGVNKLETAIDSKVGEAATRVIARNEDRLVPNFQETIPRSGSHGHPIFRHTQATNAVVVAC